MKCMFNTSEPDFQRVESTGQISICKELLISMTFLTMFILIYTCWDFIISNPYIYSPKKCLIVEWKGTFTALLMHLSL